MTAAKRETYSEERSLNPHCQPEEAIEETQPVAKAIPESYRNIPIFYWLAQYLQCQCVSAIQ